jgi:PAS domain S-box-containing protein
MNADRPSEANVQASISLEVSQEALDCLLHTTSSGFWYLDAQGNIQAVNPSYCQLSGFTEAELLRMHISDLEANEEPEETAAHLGELREKGFLRFETRHRRKDGSLWDVEVSSSFLDGPGGGRGFAFLRDISKARRATEALTAQVDFNHRVFNATDAHLAVVGADGIILSVNEAWSQFASRNMGGDESTWGVGARYFRKCSEEYGDTTMAREAFEGIRRVQSGQEARFSLEYPCHGPDGEQRWFLMQVFPLQGDPGSAMVSHVNITERKLAEEALKQSERLLKASQGLARVGGWEREVNSEALFWTDETYRIHDLAPGEVDPDNPEFRARLLECYDPEDRPVIMQAFMDCIEKGQGYDKDFSYTTFGGRRIWVRVTAMPIMEDGKVVRVVGNMMDITDRTLAQQELLKMEKLESLGVLAGGIAHDFNNILTGIMGNLSMLRTHLGPDHPALKALTDAEGATCRAESLAYQLLTFARGGEPIKSEADLAELVEEALSLSLRGSSVKGFVDIPGSLYGVKADAGQLSQAFHNIIINAKQAMPEGGELRITAANETLDEPGHYGLESGQYVRLEFTDNGPGICPEVQQRIFDPYFTTKGQGTGLGLASVFSIVTRHGGTAQVRSEQGQGATFVVYLPATGRAPQTEKSAETTAAVSEPLFHGRVLVMDDEEIILELAEAMLEYLGFGVVLCRGGEESLEIYRQAMEQGAPFRLAILDLTVPGGMGGKEAARSILGLDPQASLLVSSGYSNDPVLANYQAYGFGGSVAKPYNIQQLRQALTGLLRGVNS